MRRKVVCSLSGIHHHTQPDKSDLLMFVTHGLATTIFEDIRSGHCTIEVYQNRVKANGWDSAMTNDANAVKPAALYKYLAAERDAEAAGRNETRLWQKRPGRLATRQSSGALDRSAGI